MEAQPPDCQPQEYGLTNSELEICQSTFFFGNVASLRPSHVRRSVDWSAIIS